MSEEEPEAYYYRQIQTLAGAAYAERQSLPRWTSAWYAADGRYLILMDVLRSYDD